VEAYLMRASSAVSRKLPKRARGRAYTMRDTYVGASVNATLEWSRIVS